MKKPAAKTKEVEKSEYIVVEGNFNSPEEFANALRPYFSRSESSKIIVSHDSYEGISFLLVWREDLPTEEYKQYLELKKKFEP